MLMQTVEMADIEDIDDQAYENLDKRGTQEPIPDNLDYYLTTPQLESIYHLEEFGWQLAFVRRPLFSVPTVVLASPEGRQYAVIDEDGSLDLEPNLQLRCA